MEAVQSLTPDLNNIIESPATDENTLSSKQTKHSLQIPLFVHGKTWRELPFLPKPEQLDLPPKYVADLLVGLYFNHLHYTFPVLYKPYFMEQCQRIYSRQGDKSADGKFLSVFFAVCACASSLLSADTSSSGFPGIDYYEKALLLHFASIGQASLEKVQCLALLAMCTAGWNTLSTSWNYTGQAARVAQDLGMHLSSLVSTQKSQKEWSMCSLFRYQKWITHYTTSRRLE